MVHLRVSAVWFAVLAAVGCGDKGPALLKVEGKVLLDGKPISVPVGYVMLHPDAGKGNKSQERPIGTINKDGTYRVLTGAREGVEPGWYKVAVTAGDPATDYYIKKQFIPERYMKPDASNLAIQIAEKAPPGAYDIKLDSK